MTEHKFGTWYPIEELTDVDRYVIFANKMGMFIDRIGASYVPIREPLFWMPLPPPLSEKLSALAGVIVDLKK